MTISAETTIKAQFYDLDPMGVVWHGNYTRFLEQARCALLEKIGYNYDEMSRSGYAWPIIDLHIRYVGPIKFYQDIVLTATLVEVENRLKISYIAKDATTGEVVTRAHTIQVAVHLETKEMCLESPPALLDKVKGMM